MQLCTHTVPPPALAERVVQKLALCPARAMLQAYVHDDAPGNERAPASVDAAVVRAVLHTMMLVQH